MSFPRVMPLLSICIFLFTWGSDTVRVVALVLNHHVATLPTCDGSSAHRDDNSDDRSELELEEDELSNVQFLQIGIKTNVLKEEDANQTVIESVDSIAGRDQDAGEVYFSDPQKHEGDLHPSDVVALLEQGVEHKETELKGNKHDPRLVSKSPIAFIEPALTERADPKDWLYHVHTPACGPTVLFDNPQDSWTSCIALPVLFMFCSAAIIASINGNVSSTDDAAPTRPERMYHLDFARIVAVMCVIFEHTGGEGYTHRNVGFGLWWAMPFFCLTSGMACMMSRSSMLMYTMRLSVLFIVGVSANWIADIVSHRDWQGNFADTIFQMFFVVMLIVMAFITEPLRLVLNAGKSRLNPTSMGGVMAYTIFMGILTLIGLWFFVQALPMFPFELGTQFGQFYKPLTEHLPLFLVEFCGTFFLCLLAGVLRPKRDGGVVGWVLLLWIYLPQVLVPWHQHFFPRLLSLYMFSMVTFVHPLAGGESIARWVRAYWPFMFMLLCLLHMPDMEGRCDMFPPGLLWERYRHLSGECILAVCFITGAFATSDPYGVTVWMGWWALFAYCFHVSFFRMLGSPYGAALTFAFIPVFFAIHTHVKKPQSKANVDEKANPEQQVLANTSSNVLKKNDVETSF